MKKQLFNKITGKLNLYGISFLFAFILVMLGQMTTSEAVIAPASYVIYKGGTTYYAQNGQTGVNDYSGTDAATVIQNVIDALINGGLIILKNATYVIATPVSLDSSISVQGESRAGTIIQAAASIGGTGTRGLFELDDFGVTTTPITNVYIGNMTFDLTTNTDAYIKAIGQRAYRPVQNLLIEKINMDLDTEHNGIVLENLGISSTIASYNITIKDIFTRNGSGTVNLYLNASAASSLYYNVKIENLYNLIDVNGVGDDRVAIIGNFPAGGGVAEVRGVSIRDVYVFVASTVTSGLIQGVKFDTGANCYLHDMLVDGVFFVNAPSGTIGQAVSSILGGNSFFQNATISNVFSKNGGGIKMFISRRDPNPFIIIEKFAMYNLQDTIAGIEVYDPQGPSGDETVIIRNGSLFNAATIAGNLPVGIMFTGGSLQGGSGIISIEGVFINSFSRGISNNLNESGSLYTSTWTNIFVENCNLANNGSNLSAVGNFQVRTTPAISLAGVTGITVGASPFTYTNNDNVPEAIYIDGGTVSDIKKNGTTIFTSTQKTIWLEPGESITVTYSQVPTMRKDQK